MWTILLLSSLWPIGGLSTVIPPVGKGFSSPDKGSLTSNGKIEQLPLSFNLSGTQHRGEVQIDGSFWANSFIHGSNGHDYYIASHIMNYASDIPGATPIYRASILDITDPSYFRKFLRFAPTNSSFWTRCGDFRARFEGFGMESISKDPLQGIHTYTSLDGINFDLTFNFTSPVLLNAALGSYWVGGELGWEWSLPRAHTQGSLNVGGEKIEIVSEKSFTWYDRQWGSLQDSFDWIMLHFEESDWLDITLMSVWNWKDVVNGPKQFATIRNSKTFLDSVVPLSVKASSTNVWTSPDTGLVYPQEWTVALDDLEIVVKSPRPDQVAEAAPETGFPSQFSGYVNAVAKKAGHAPVRGYGAVDRITIG